MSSEALFYLASASPRRKDLLAQLGLRFSVFPVDIDETPEPQEAAQDYVARLAAEKASTALARLDVPPGIEAYVLGSDTSVVLQDRILGKPENRDDFVAMMRALSGARHQVMSGISVIHIEQGKRREQQTRVVRTNVQFRALDDAEIAAYWQTNEPQDKAGGYGIQGKGALLVAGIEGSYSNVVGLPLAELAVLLRQMGLDVWQHQTSPAQR